MRLFILSISLLLTSSLLAQKLTDHADSLLTVTRAHYSLKYPTSWTIDTSKMFGADVLFRSPKTDALDGFSENMNVFVQDLHGQHYNLIRMGQESEAQLKNMITDFQVIDSRLDSAASPQHYILQYKGRQGKFLLTILQQYYIKDEIGYALTFTIEGGKENEYIPIANKIFNSFQFQ